MRNPIHYSNPILPGYSPDPSICRAGEDFYLVTSTFAYFPGLPVYHSRDLVNWKIVGHALDRPSQLPLEGAQVSQGLFAPTIRCHKGVFYVICTNVSGGGNFIVTAKDPAGPWSEPHWLADAPGIDPSLFFDDDGRAWYCGTRPAPEGERYQGNWEVWLRELDLTTMSLKGEARGLWRGALRECIWPEGPHIYKKDGWYYLMAAEGGTCLDHAISIARSRSLEGPFVGKSANPIVTHRHLGKNCPVINVGHGDLVDDPTGKWWMVLLASRPNDGACNLGRETFLVPVEWEDEWPLPCPGSGRIDGPFRAPDLKSFDAGVLLGRDDFERASLDPEWMSLRRPASAFASLAERPGWLRLRASASTLREKGEVSYIGRRQRHMSFSIRTVMEFSPTDAGDAAGLVLFQSEDFQYRLELGHSDQGTELRLVAAEGGPDRILARRPYSGSSVILEARAEGQNISFSAGKDPEKLEMLASGIDGRILSTERAGGFVGTTLGIFATSGAKSGSERGELAADFDLFEYREILL